MYVRPKYIIGRYIVVMIRVRFSERGERRKSDDSLTAYSCMLTTQTSLTSYKKHPPTYLYFRHSYDLTEHSNTMDNRNNQPKPELVHKLEGCTDEVNGAVILPGQ